MIQMEKRKTRGLRKASKEIAPPPIRVGGIRLVLEIEDLKKSCTFKGNSITTEILEKKQNLLIEKVASKFPTISDADKSELLQLLESLNSGDLREVRLFANKFTQKPARLAQIRDLAREIVNTDETSKITLLPSNPFKPNKSGIQGEVLSLVIKEKSTDIVIFVASHPLMDNEVYAMKKSPVGVSELEFRRCDADELFKRIVK